MDDGVPRGLVGDALRLSQVLTNLIGNAIKFTASGEVAVCVTVIDKDETARQAHLCFVVTDTGITPEQRGHLFQAFSQASAATTRDYGGSGLGLAISKHLVDRMDGKIGVDSEPGKGSRFYFDARFGLSDLTAQEAAAPIPAGLHAGLEGLRILLVEDNAINQELATRFLTKAGIIVTSANHGQEALEKLICTDEPFDLVLMGYADAHSGRHHRHKDDPCRCPSGRPADHCHDSQCDDRRSRPLSRRRHAKLSVQAHRPGTVVRHDRALDSRSLANPDPTNTGQPGRRSRNG
jgi:hypothetical protein